MANVRLPQRSEKCNPKKNENVIKAKTYTFGTRLKRKLKLQEKVETNVLYID